MTIETSSELTPVSRRPRLMIGLLAAIGVGVLAIDQVTKTIAQGALDGREPVPLIGDLIQFSLHYNSGAAFSMATGLTWVLTLIALAVVVVIIRISRKLGSIWWAVALGLLLGGAMGNLTDRLFRFPGPGSGYVIDFIHLKGFAIFNVADIAISCAAVLVVILALRGIGIDGTKTSQTAESESDEANPEISSDAVPVPSDIDTHQTGSKEHSND